MRHLVVLLGGALILVGAAMARGSRPKSDPVRRVASAPIVECMPAPQAQVLEVAEVEADDCRDPGCTECLRPGR